MRKDYLQSPGREENEIDFIVRIMMTSSLAQQLAIGGSKLDFIKPIHKWQGILRNLYHEFGLSYDWFLVRALSVLLTPFIPSVMVAHMYMAVAQKPSD